MIRIRGTYRKNGGLDLTSTLFARGGAFLLAAALTSTAMVPSVAAQTLFDLLFKQEQRNQRPVVVAPPPLRETAVQRPVAPKPVVKAPQYYTYKAVAPLSFTAAQLVADVKQDALAAPSLQPSPFREAVALSGDLTFSADKVVRDAVIAYYKANPDFLWSAGYRSNERADAANAVLINAGQVGLVARDYKVAQLGDAFDLADLAPRLRDLVRYDVAMSIAVLTYAMDSRYGRVDANKISEFHDFEREPFEGEAALSRFAASIDSASVLASFQPRDPAFAALTAELATLRSETETQRPINKDTFIRPGESHDELPDVIGLVKAVLAEQETSVEIRAALEIYSGDTLYTKELVPAVKAAQAARGAKPDGVVGPNTITALQGRSVGERIRQAELALERLRWLPDSLGTKHVLINVPAFRASYVVENQEALGMNVVVGTERNQTYFFSDTIEYVEWNPYWGVPQSIIVNEMLPKLRNDPGYLDRIGYEVFSGNKRVSSSSVDWWGGGYKKIAVRQPPSEKNALGELKIMFPNKHDIYMHDTPAKGLFSRTVRAYSHGCVRLADPRAMAAAVLQVPLSTVEASLRQGHGRTDLSEKLPVHVAYFTAWPDDLGKVHYFADIYDRDEALEKAIEVTETARAGTIVAQEG
jgi:murein L,D-transpeptidase YcbB/YkuD